MPASGGQSRIVIKSTKGITPTWSKDGRHYAYSKEGNVFFASIDDKEARQITGKKPDADKQKAEAAVDKAKEDPAKDGDKKKEAEKFTAVRLSPEGNWLVASNKDGLWLIDTTTQTKEMFLKTGEEDKESPRYQTLEFSPESGNIFLSYASRAKWERGLVRYDVKAKRLEDVIKDSRLYSGFRISKDGRTAVFSSADGGGKSAGFLSFAHCSWPSTL